jgi:hypothetical protein
MQNRSLVSLCAAATLAFAGLSVPISILSHARAADAPPNDALKWLYDDKVRLEQLSGAARSQLELMYGKKAGPGPGPSSAADPQLQGPSSPPIEDLSLGFSNQLVNNPNADTTQRDTQSETTLVLGSGANIVAAFNDSGSSLSGPHFTGFSRSTNSGASWTDQGTLPASANGDVGDPVLARNNFTGTTYLSTLRFAGTPGIQVFRSTNDGATFTAPVNGVPGLVAGNFADKEWMTVDNFAGPGAGNIYLAYRLFGAGASDGIRLTRSINGGATWSPAAGTLIAAAGAGNVQGAWVTVGPDHTLYVFWYDENFTPRRIRMRKSINQGVTFGAPVTVATLPVAGVNGNLGLNGGFRTNSFPQAAVNPVSGNLYVTYDAKGVSDQADIFFTNSTDGGTTWSAPVRVNDDSTSHDQWQPALAVTPNGGNLFIGFYDRRLDPANKLIDTFGVVAQIEDEGASEDVFFGANFRITTASFPVVVGQDPSVVATYMGDYDQAVADSHYFYYTWGDNRLANPNFPAHAHQPDVRFARIARDQDEL